MQSSLRIEALEPRDFFSASLGGDLPDSGSVVTRGGQVLYVDYFTGGGAPSDEGPVDGFTTEPQTVEAKEQFTRNKPHIMPPMPRN